MQLLYSRLSSPLLAIVLRMAKFSCGVLTVLLWLALNIVVHFSKGQSTIGDEIDEPGHDKYSCDASFALAKSIQSDVQSIKAQIAHLEKRVESQGTYMNYSIQEINGQMQRQNTYANDKIRRLSG